VEARAAALHWGVANADIEVLAGGNINESFLVSQGVEKWVLQRVPSAMDSKSLEAIAAITAHVEAEGIAVPIMLRTVAGELVAGDADGRKWRFQKYIDGRVVQLTDSVERCNAAGRLVGRLHNALSTYTGPMCASPIHAGDAHIFALRKAWDAARGSREHDAATRMTEAVTQAWQLLPRASVRSSQPSHGDLKIANLVFGEDGEGRGVLDFDTASLLPLAIEIGDALRSWCVSGGRGDGAIYVDADRVAAAIAGYSNTVSRLDLDDLACVYHGMVAVSIELTARFMLDAFGNTWFRWDRDLYSSSFEHNMERARRQWMTLTAIERHRHDIERAIIAGYSSAGPKR
jgi:Ser/Thr protein kinase RdoA (MazF antagonist)